MVNYQQGKIYKIVCNTTGLIYVGSTCKQRLSQRLTKHVAHYKQYLKGNYNKCASYDIIEKGNYEIILLESCPCETNDELLKRERHFVESLECVNINKPFSTIEDKRESWRKFYEAHPDKIKAYKQEYREKNVEKIKNSNKEYREKNKEKIKQYFEEHKEERKQYLLEYSEKHKEKLQEQKREYRENNKEKIKQYLEENKEIRKKKRQIKDLYLKQLKYYNI